MITVLGYELAIGKRAKSNEKISYILSIYVGNVVVMEENIQILATAFEIRRNLTHTIGSIVQTSFKRKIDVNVIPMF